MIRPPVLQARPDEIAAPPDWLVAIQQAQRAVQEDDVGGWRDALMALNEVWAVNRGALGRGARHMWLYRSLLTFKLTGQYEPAFEQLPGAQVQIWELEAQWPDLAYQKAFLAAAITQFGPRPGFKMFENIFNAVDPKVKSDFFDDPEADFQIHRRPGATLTIVGFSGLNNRFAGLGWNSFDRAVAQPLNANVIVVRDYHRRLYLAGVESMGDYAATVAGIKAALAEFKDTRIVAAGGSGGVFGAINIACDLDIRHIVAFGGPTSLELGEGNEDRQVYRKIADEAEAGQYSRPDLTQRVNASPIERIDFFVAGGHAFDFAQMRNLASACSCVVPHVYEGWTEHIVTDLAIADGSILQAFAE
jgi:hypothetical protein